LLVLINCWKTFPKINYMTLMICLPSNLSQSSIDDLNFELRENRLNIFKSKALWKRKKRELVSLEVQLSSRSNKSSNLLFISTILSYLNIWCPSQNFKGIYFCGKQNKIAKLMHEHITFCGASYLRFLFLTYYTRHV